MAGIPEKITQKAGTLRIPPMTVGRARRSLFSQKSVRLVRNLCQEHQITAFIVGGAVRDTFLKRKSKDIDLMTAAESASRLCGALEQAVRGRVLVLGQPPRRIFRVINDGPELDVWEIPGPVEADLLRRDFTVNALSFRLPDGRFQAPESALEDISLGWLRLPRPGVLLEDPLRVLRAARFLIQLPRFRVHPSALPEIRAASLRLLSTAPERRLTELDHIFSATLEKTVHALRNLESWGALACLLPETTGEERAKGLRLLARTASPLPSFRRLLLLWPLGLERALSHMESFMVPAREIQLLRSLDRMSRFRPEGTSEKEKAVRLLRAARPFIPETLEFLRLTLRRQLQHTVSEGLRLSKPSRRLERLLSPKRPFTVERIKQLTNLEDGPRLGLTLAELDVFLASTNRKGQRAITEYLKKFRR